MTPNMLLADLVALRLSSNDSGVRADVKEAVAINAAPPKKRIPHHFEFSQRTQCESSENHEREPRTGLHESNMVSGMRRASSVRTKIRHAQNTSNYLHRRYEI